MRQVRQVAEKRLDVKIFELGNNQAEDIVLCRLKLLYDFSLAGLVHRLEILQYALNVVLDVRLFETAPMEFFLYVLQLLYTLFFPV